MIELSGYTGKSANSVKDRLVAATEMQASRAVQSKKHRIKYSTQTLVMGSGFSVIADGFISPKHVEVEVSCPVAFEEFILSTVKSKHRKPSHMHKDGKHTIFSKMSNGNIYVDIIELKMN